MTACAEARGPRYFEGVLPHWAAPDRALLIDR
jgi:hypothetical protein